MRGRGKIHRMSTGPTCRAVWHIQIGSIARAQALAHPQQVTPTQIAGAVPAPRVLIS